MRTVIVSAVTAWLLVPSTVLAEDHATLRTPTRAKHEQRYLRALRQGLDALVDSAPHMPASLRLEVTTKLEQARARATGPERRLVERVLVRLRAIRAPAAAVQRPPFDLERLAAAQMDLHEALVALPPRDLETRVRTTASIAFRVVTARQTGLSEAATSKLQARVRRACEALVEGFPDEARAHAVLGSYLLHVERDRFAALLRYRRCIALDPNHGECRKTTDHLEWELSRPTCDTTQLHPDLTLAAKSVSARHASPNVLVYGATRSEVQLGRGAIAGVEGLDPRTFAVFLREDAAKSLSNWASAAPPEALASLYLRRGGRRVAFAPIRSPVARPILVEGKLGDVCATTTAGLVRAVPERNFVHRLVGLWRVGARFLKFSADGGLREFGGDPTLERVGSFRRDGDTLTRSDRALLGRDQPSGPSKCKSRVFVSERYFVEEVFLPAGPTSGVVGRWKQERACRDALDPVRTRFEEEVTFRDEGTLVAGPLTMRYRLRGDHVEVLDPRTKAWSFRATLVEGRALAKGPVFERVIVPGIRVPFVPPRIDLEFR